MVGQSKLAENETWSALCPLKISMFSLQLHRSWSIFVRPRPHNCENIQLCLRPALRTPTGLGLFAHLQPLKSRQRKRQLFTSLANHWLTVFTVSGGCVSSYLHHTDTNTKVLVLFANQGYGSGILLVPAPSKDRLRVKRWL